MELQITFLRTQRLQTSIFMVLDKRTQNIEKDEDGHGKYTLDQLFLHTQFFNSLAKIMKFKRQIANQHSMLKYTCKCM